MENESGFSTLKNLYWNLRFSRSWQKSRRRYWYRRIASEKKRLLEAGVVELEQLRLLCRHLANPRLDYRYERYCRYVEEVLPGVLEQRKNDVNGILSD